MSIPDALMRDYFLLCTDVSEGEFVPLVEDAVAGRVNPMEVKHRLSREIVAIYHGDTEAGAAQDEWKRVHSQRQVPSAMPTCRYPRRMSEGGTVGILRLVQLADPSQSKSGANAWSSRGASATTARR
jgi:tyrosyl-tRNA synthetase